MTSKLTREENVQAVFDLKAGYTLGLADVEILKRVARMALVAMDSEPDRNPVLAYADSYRDMAKQGVESVPIWSVITDLERNIAPLYRHAQPAQVVMDVMEPTIEAIKRILPTSNPDEYAACIGADMWNACRAAMLQAQSEDDDGEPTNDERIMAIEGIHNCERCSDGGWVIGEMGITRCACGQADSSPVIPGAEQRIADAVELLQKAAPEMLADNGGPDGPLAGRMKSPVIPDGWQVEAEKLAEMHGMSFVLFRHGEAPQCADPTKVVISFTDKGLGHDTLPSGPKEEK
ncbi:hypothetical protein [Klebsiella pneumoniae]|uniref:hypothetical protein n=1 Tax=Klebsiella pneumoniae TaxID=573 RepID=UPI002005CDE7|nr:hypothetical protein [Klebsiella pneumoniae]